MKIFSNTVIAIFGIVVLIMLLAFILKMINPKPSDPNLDKNIVKNTATEVIQINILNASGIKGIASTAKDYLRSKGFDVVEIGNYIKQVDNSFILDRVGDSSSAAKVAFAIGISDTLVKVKIDSTLFVRNSIILGKDYSKLKPFKSSIK